MSQIKFKKQVVACGKNGTAKQIGLDLYPATRIDENNNSFPTIVLNAVNSYGDLLHGWIEIPLDNVDELIEHLIFLRDDQPTKT